MVDELKTQPIEERKSQKVGFSDYAKDKLFWGFLPLIAGAAGYALGKARVFPLDGSPMILIKLKTKAWGMIFGKEVEKQVAEDMKDLNFYLGGIKDDKQRLEVAKDIWNFLKTVEIAAIPSIYHLWKNKEGQNLELKDVAQKLKDVDAYKPSNAELAEENTSLRQQLAFVERENGKEANTTLSASSATLEGKVTGVSITNGQSATL